MCMKIFLCKDSSAKIQILQSCVGKHDFFYDIYGSVWGFKECGIKCEDKLVIFM